MLPEHLFLDDFIHFFKEQNKKTYKTFTRVFENSENHDEALRLAISEVTFAGEMSFDHPMCEKLALYTSAHRNYLASLT